MAATFVSDFLAALEGASRDEFLEACPFPALVEAPPAARGLGELALEDSPERRAEVVERRLQKLGEVAGGARLYFVAPPERGDGRIVAGRASGAAVFLDAQSVSGRHAEFSRRRGLWRLRDLESKNGTAVEGRRLAVGVPVALTGGEYVRVGTVELVFLTPEQLYRFAVACRKVASPGLVLPAQGVRLLDLTEVVSDLPVGSEEVAYLLQVPVEGLEAAAGKTDRAGATLELSQPAILSLQRARAGEDVRVHSLVPPTGAEYLVLGRGSEADLVLPEKSVSKAHARARRRKGLWQLMDLESANGTFVGSSRLPPGVLTAVRPGEMIRFARYAAILIKPEDLRDLLLKLRKRTMRVHKRGTA